MFTGIPSVYISRHYNDFVFDESEIDSIVTMLKSNGYSIYSIFDAKALRCGLQNMAHSLPAKYRPKTSDHDKWWHNAEITRNVEHLFKKNYVNSPAFFLMWYNCRLDTKTSYHIERSIDIFKANNMWDDSIVIMNSDHGYPDPSTGLTVETMKKYSHDMIVTDDNSRVPLIIKYPGCPKGRKIHEVVRTSDIFHTINELLEIDNIDKSKMNYTNTDNGRSLLALVNGKDNQPRIARIDTRLTKAHNRVTALRSDNYKYVYYVDKDKEEFFDIIEDYYEMENIIFSDDKAIKEQVEYFRTLYQRQEKNIFNYHSQILRENVQKEIGKHFRRNKRNGVIEILLTCTPLTPYIVLELLVKYLSISCSGIKIDLILPNKIDKKYNGLDLRRIISVDKMLVENIRQLSIVNNNYDFVLYLTEGSKYNYVDPLVVKALKIVNSKKFFMMDYNFTMYSHMLSRWFYPIIRFVSRNWKYYKGEPLGYILKDITYVIYGGIRVNVLNYRGQTFDTEEIKQMRDKSVLANAENPITAINQDREKDRILRLKLSGKES